MKFQVRMEATETHSYGRFITQGISWQRRTLAANQRQRKGILGHVGVAHVAVFENLIRDLRGLGR